MALTRLFTVTARLETANGDRGSMFVVTLTGGGAHSFDLPVSEAEFEFLRIGKKLELTPNEA